ncbi:hypothetical protein E4U19_003923 [Claviceps sp. Clav32 group G5]|nr:hypothetical protein E4U19_003923 [Claviceps sp. Clav32 group G5]KAG6050169.1 hypothetical protein E4U39_004729 [Claviceps sp. Clav50 group G5]
MVLENPSTKHHHRSYLARKKAIARGSMQPKVTLFLARLQHGCHNFTGRAVTRPIRLHTRGALTRAASTKPASTKTASATTAPLYVASNDVARKLNDTAVWGPKGTLRRRKAVAQRAFEPNRVNVVSDGLCDDIVKYIGPSIERHRGCDLLDLNPGPGVWSRKLHDYLQPRNHIMMDLDAELYKPFLDDLLAKKNVKLVRKSGFVWKNLLETIETHLPDQHQLPLGATQHRNDTLLVTANLSLHPKKVFSGFSSLSAMVLYQMLMSIRTSTLFQRYGLVRMMIWMNDDDKRKLIPRVIHRRGKRVFETELSVEWMHEVAGLQTGVQDRTALRDEWINMESASQTMQRMQTAGLTMPKGRESIPFLKLQSQPELIGQRLAGVRPPQMARPYKQELEALENESCQSEEALKRARLLRLRDTQYSNQSLLYLGLLQEWENALQLASSEGSSSAAFQEANSAWNERIDALTKNGRNEFNAIRDTYHIFRQSPPVLLWDRRAYEPLTASDVEFFPNAPTSLVDIQPKAMNPLFCQLGPNSSRAGDMSDLMLRSWYTSTLDPVRKSMDAIWGGFGDLIEECPSLRDVSRGGSPMTNHGEMIARMINEEQWCEIMQAWMNWPFRPEYPRMLARLVEDAEVETDEDDTWSSAMGGGSTI